MRAARAIRGLDLRPLGVSLDWTALTRREVEAERGPVEADAQRAQVETPDGTGRPHLVLARLGAEQFMTVDAVGGIWQYGLDLAEEMTRRGVAVTLAVLGSGPSTARVTATPRRVISSARSSPYCQMPPTASTTGGRPSSTCS
jgi:hypothetical protein